MASAQEKRPSACRAASTDQRASSTTFPAAAQCIHLEEPPKRGPRVRCRVLHRDPQPRGARTRPRPTRAPGAGAAAAFSLLARWIEECGVEVMTRLGPGSDLGYGVGDGASCRRPAEKATPSIAPSRAPAGLRIVATHLHGRLRRKPSAAGGLPTKPDQQAAGYLDLEPRAWGRWRLTVEGELAEPTGPGIDVHQTIYGVTPQGEFTLERAGHPYQ